MTALIAALAVLGYLAWAYLHPFRSCRRCKGSGVNSGSTNRRWGNCRRCKGSRRVSTLGARALHRGVRAIREHRRRQL